MNLTVNVEGRLTHDALVAALRVHKGALSEMTNVSLLAWFYRASPAASLPVLWQLVESAAIKAGVISKGSVVYGSFEQRSVSDEGNPFGNKAATKIRVGRWT